MRRANTQYRGYAEYLRYVAIMDSRTRDTHRSLHGTILHRNNKFWEKNYPPNGWGCRCRVDAWTKMQIEKRGWIIQESDPKWFKADKDWNYDTRCLEPNDDALSRVIKQKIEKLTKADDPDKIIRSYLNESLGELKKERRYWEKLKAFFDNPKGVFEIAILGTKLKEVIGAKTDKIFLSDQTLLAHKNKHPEITAFHYYLVRYMQKNALFAIKKGDEKVVLLKKLGVVYEVVFKTTKSKKEVYVTTVFRVKDVAKEKTRLLKQGEEIKL
jgi:hypothetical protein